jgi:hypothetical protein
VYQSIGRLKEARDRAAPDNMTYYQSLVKKAYGVSMHDQSYDCSCHWVYLNIEWLYKLETKHGVAYDHYRLRRLACVMHDYSCSVILYRLIPKQ